MEEGEKLSRVGGCALFRCLAKSFAPRQTHKTDAGASCAIISINVYN